MDVEFLPLHVKECVTRLSLTSIELGVYHYDLKMNATVPKPERSLQFKVGLGSSQTQTLRFMSYSRSKVEYTCKLESTDFVVEKTVIAHAGKCRDG